MLREPFGRCRNPIRENRMIAAAGLFLSVPLILWTTGCGQKDAKVIEERTYIVQVATVEKK